MTKITKTHPLFDKFLHLSIRLSPENVSCDGECSRAEVNRRYAQIAREWKELERQIGYKVIEQDIWDAERN